MNGLFCSEEFVPISDSSAVSLDHSGVHAFAVSQARPFRGGGWPPETRSTGIGSVGYHIHHLSSAQGPQLCSTSIILITIPIAVFSRNFCYGVFYINALNVWDVGVLCPQLPLCVRLSFLGRRELKQAYLGQAVGQIMQAYFAWSAGKLR